LTDVTKEVNAVETKLDQSVSKLVRARVEHAVAELKDELTQHVEDMASVANGVVSNQTFDLGDIEITTSNVVENNTGLSTSTTARRGRKKTVLSENISTTAAVV
jgi:hypothetical protein